MDRNHLVVGLFLVLIAAATGAYVLWGSEGSSVYEPTSIASSTDQTASSTDALAEGESDHSYGTLTLKLNEIASFPGGFSLRPTSVLEDSRCPQGVQCIQAGTVRVSARTRSGSDTSAHEFKLGSTVSVSGTKVTLLSVEPQKQKDKTIQNSDYRLTFRVEQAPAPAATTSTKPSSTKQCYVGGCSSQLCTDSPNAISTCEYSAMYACYKAARCEVQSNGQCGWTQTPESAACLANPPQSQTSGTQTQTAEPQTVPDNPQ